MGGRGSKSGLSSGYSSTPAGASQVQQQQAAPQQQQPKMQQQQPQQQAPLQPGSLLQTQAQAAATLAQISQMSDDQIAQAVRDSRTVDMPNFLNDAPDPTQKFVYQVGLNGAPTVMDQAQLDQFMKQNGISKSQMMSRSVSANGPYTAKQILDTFKYSELNYVGGKHGGMVHGAGTYFDMNGGGNTGYGGTTMTAILNPHTARIIDHSTLNGLASKFARQHPKFAQAVGGAPRSGQGGNLSIYALAMGYNVIRSGSYHNVIDRSAVIVLK